MRFGGESRKRIARTLSAGYAAGLLSEDTYAQRVDELLGSAVLQPARLAGDLTFRRRRPRHPAGETITGRVRGMLRRDDAPDPETLLALDWTGTTRELSLGRSRSCDVVFPELGVSRCHAQMRYRDGRWILQDLASTNGTFVNGVRVGRCEVLPGDHLSLGSRDLLID